MRLDVVLGDGLGFGVGLLDRVSGCRICDGPDVSKVFRVCSLSFRCLVRNGCGAVRAMAKGDVGGTADGVVSGFARLGRTAWTHGFAPS